VIDGVARRKADSGGYRDRDAGDQDPEQHASNEKSLQSVLTASNHIHEGTSPLPLGPWPLMARSGYKG
jgi:hypothetical protein